MANDHSLPCRKKSRFFPQSDSNTNPSAADVQLQSPPAQFFISSRLERLIPTTQGKQGDPLQNRQQEIYGERSPEENMVRTLPTNHKTPRHASTTIHPISQNTQAHTHLDTVKLPLSVHAGSMDQASRPSTLIPSSQTPVHTLSIRASADFPSIPHTPQRPVDDNIKMDHTMDLCSVPAKPFKTACEPQRPNLQCMNDQSTVLLGLDQNSRLLATSISRGVYNHGTCQRSVAGHGVTASNTTSRNNKEECTFTFPKASTPASSVQNSPSIVPQPNRSYQCLPQRVIMASNRSDNPTSRHNFSIDGQISNTMLDLDRDAHGALLPSQLRNSPALSSHRLLRCAGNDSGVPLVPVNWYTSPQRLERAMNTSSANLKRKRLSSEVPPPAYVYVHSGSVGFNIFAHGFLLYPELCFMLASQMPLRDLVSLYSISRDFHVIIDSRFTTVCLAQTLQKASESAQTFRFRLYKEYCRNDPASRIPHPDPKKAAQNIPRQIPSFCWVAFVLHREKVVQEIMAIFAERGCPLPPRCTLALKRIWALLDVPDNARRIAMVHNRHLLTDLDMYFLMCFFVKLDMVANDPVVPEKRDGLRKLLLSQQGGLDVVHKVLKREMWQKKSDFITAWVRTSMNIDNIQTRELDAMDVRSILGVPRSQVGLGKYEYWGQKGVFDESTGRKRPYLLRPDQLVMREAIRRGLTFSKHFLNCVLYGYIREDTLENHAPQGYGRRVKAWKDENYGLDDTVGGVRALAVEDGGDPLLDLGDCSRGSEWTIQKERVSEQEHNMRAGQENLLRGLYEAVAREQQLHG